MNKEREKDKQTERKKERNKQTKKKKIRRNKEGRKKRKKELLNFKLHTQEYFLTDIL